MEECEWVIVSHLDAALRPVGPFIATMEASEKVTSSLVIPMTLAIIHATSKDVPVHCYSYEFGELSEDVSTLPTPIKQALFNIKRTVRTLRTPLNYSDNFDMNFGLKERTNIYVRPDQEN